MTPSRVIIPGSGTELLRCELALAFAALGCRVEEAAPEELRDPGSERSLSRLLDGPGALLVSVNFQGLGDLRATLELLDRAGARAAVWCVDNPWNLLSGVRDPRWRRVPLFVTDAAFAAPLRANGAEQVFHLPLAAAPELFAPNAARDAAFPPPEDLAPLVFAGRSAFPGKAAFFAGLEPPPELLAAARALLHEGGRPDLCWWERALGSAPPFWPGKSARLPALGAEECNALWRERCVAGAALAGLELRGVADGAPAGKPGLDLFGDAGWRLPPHVRLRPPVDYYARLPGIYAKARYSLCLTSLQLPSGLNQRHFDVWAAGGFLLTDASPGLDLFPEELVRPVRFDRPDGIARLIRSLEGGHGREALAADWRSLVLSRHTYVHRARALLEALA